MPNPPVERALATGQNEPTDAVRPYGQAPAAPSGGWKQLLLKVVFGVCGAFWLTMFVADIAGDSPMAPAIHNDALHFMLAIVVVSFVTWRHDRLAARLDAMMVEAAVYANRRHEGISQRVDEMSTEHRRAMVDLAAANATRLAEIEADHGRQFEALAKMIEALAIRLDESVSRADRRFDALTNMSIEHSLMHGPEAAETLPQTDEDAYDRGYADGLARTPMRPQLRSVDG